MLMTDLTFRPLVPEDAAWAAPLLMKSGRMGCEYSFTTLYMWRKLYHVRIAHAGEYLFVMSGPDGSQSFLPPIGPSLEEGLRLLKAHTDAAGIPLRLHGVEQWMLDQWGAVADVREHPEDFDYLYRTADLADLPGKTYHSKKNHIARFTREFPWQYEPLTDENLPDVLMMADRWCAEKGACQEDGLRTERCGIREVLKDRRRFSVVGGLIRVNGDVAAFSFGSPVNERVFDIHVEKALSRYPGAYAVINREFAARLTAYEYVNRENDMGLEGLRRRNSRITRPSC